MATNAEEIVVRFRTEGGHEVEEAFRKTADAGDRFHQKITKAGSALGDLRAKSEARVASNIGAIAQSMIGGSNAGEVLATTITKVSESFRGSLLFAAGATVGFALYEGITKAGEAAIALDTKILSLRRDTSIRGDFLGADQVNANLTSAIALVQQLQSRFITEHTGLGGEFNQALRGAFELKTRGQLEAKDAQQIADARKTVIDALSQQADKQFDINDAMRQELLGDEKVAALNREDIANREKLGQIAKAVGTIGLEGVSLAEAAETSRHNLAVAEIEKRFSLQQREFGVQENIVDIQKQLLAPAEENLSILDARIAGIENLLDTEHELTDQEREQYHIQLGQLEAAKQRAQFGRQLQKDLAGLELGRVRGGIGSDRARIEALQLRAQYAAAQGINTPEALAAEAGLEEEQFGQFQQYEKNPGAFRQKRIDEEFQRKRFDYLRSTGQLPSDIATKPIEGRDGGVVKGLQDLIETLKRLPAAVGVG